MVYKMQVLIIYLVSIHRTFKQIKTTGFVIGGGSGYGAPIYRALTKQGIGVATGIIHENDMIMK